MVSERVNGAGLEDLPGQIKIRSRLQIEKEAQEKQDREDQEERDKADQERRDQERRDQERRDQGDQERRPGQGQARDSPGTV